MRAGGFEREFSTSLVTEAASTSGGSLSAFIKLIDPVPAGHRAMTLSRWSAHASP